MEKGKLITLEGADASGKTTQMKYLVKRLREAGYDVVTGREPGGGPLAERVRDIILHDNPGAMAELLLFFVCRAENLEKIIRPAISLGKIVIFDRFVDSSYAYQGYGRGLIDQMLTLENMVLKDFDIDATLFFQLPFEQSMQRLARRSGEDRIELEGVEFKRRVYDGYQQRLKERAERMWVIKAGGTVEEVNHDLDYFIDHFIANTPL